MKPEPPISLFPDPRALGTWTDLYQLTMMAGYAANGLSEKRATFELFVRRLPEGRAYLVFAGLEQAIEALLGLRFSREQIEWLRSSPAFSGIEPSWFDELAGMRFEGDVWSAPEGSIVFAGEPIVRVEAKLPQAQWIETILLASLGYPTLVASKAARIVEAARGKETFDFGMRRGHGPLAGMICARAAYLAGFDGTSLVEASRRLDIPCVGTMAHSWVQTFHGEREAFAAFARIFPRSTTLLVDTYDTLEGVRAAAEFEPRIEAIRLDSGDLAELSVQARAILDERGKTGVKIFGGGDLDEFKIDELARAGAPIDSFGVGTELVTSRDAPALSMVYKMVALEGEGRVKLSPGKKTYPLGKQVDRISDSKGTFAGDRVIGANEPILGEPLLNLVIKNGEPIRALPTLSEARERCREQKARLPDNLRGVSAAGVYPLSYSDLLEREAERLGLKPPTDS